MKTEHLILTGLIAAASFTSGIETAMCAETGCVEDQIVAAIDPSKPIDFGTVFAVEDLHEKSEAHRKQIIQSLLKTLNTPPLSTTNKLANYDRCVAAYYLGQMGASEAVDGLAANITIRIGQLSAHDDFINGGSPAVWALIEIGSPAIPAMIKNLTESDDEQVCKRAQYVLTAIEGGDKDIVKLRLQKAMDAQTDATKKARLQLAIKRLSEPLLMDF